jgi:threonine aldolase
MVRRLRGDGGRLDLEHVEGQIRRGNVHFAATRLLCLENSTNIGGGRTYPLDQLRRVCAWAHENELMTHLDGARLFNACVARGYSPKQASESFDTVSICFSKGLGCPIGSILIGSRETIARARKARKVFGGALRQAGIVAAAALYALDHHVERLAEDHANARLFAETIASCPAIRVNLEGVETNLVFFEVDPEWGTAAQLSAALRERGVRINPLGPQRLRACTHLDVSRNQARRAAETVCEIVEATSARPRAEAAGAYA